MDCPNCDSPLPDARRLSSLAVASLLLGIVGLIVTGIASAAGLLLGLLALAQITRSPQTLRGKPLAIAGLIVSALFIFVAPQMKGGRLFFPVFSQAGDKFHQASCLDNIQQLSSALHMYVDDYDDRFPSKSAWCDAAYRYLWEKKPYRCPTVPDLTCGYAFNSQLDCYPPRKVKTLNWTVALFDAQGGSWNQSGGPELLAPRHQRGVNVAHADGHVAWHSSSDLSKLGFDPRIKQPQPPALNLPGGRTVGGHLSLPSPEQP